MTEEIQKENVFHLRFESMLQWLIIHSFTEKGAENQKRFWKQNKILN